MMGLRQGEIGEPLRALRNLAAASVSIDHAVGVSGRHSICT